MVTFALKPHVIAVAAVAVLLMPLCAFTQHAPEEGVEVELGRSSPEADDLLVESTPVKPHENVYIEDVEAQLKEIKEEAKSARKEVGRSNERIKKVKAKNYGDKKAQQKETLQALERKKKADAARLKVEQQRESVQNEVLAMEKRRIRARERAERSEESIEEAKIKLVQSKRRKIAIDDERKLKGPLPKPKKVKKVKIDFKNADAY